MRDGIRVKIQDQPFHVLILLLERPNEIVPREELKRRLWPDGTHVDFDGSLNVILKKLRGAIDDDSDNPRFIETVPRRGYRFIAPVSVEGPKADAAKVEPASPTASEPASPASVPIVPAKTATRRSFFIGIAAALILLVAIALGWRQLQKKQPIGIPLQASAQVPLRKSVAVLGFRNLSGKTYDDWLATAFAEMLSTELAEGGKLRLVSGEEVTNLRLSSPWPATDSLYQLTTARIGTALNSDVLILGSYTTVGKAERGQLRLDVRLQDARSGEILTEIAQTGNRDDLFQLVSSVGTRLRERLGVSQLGDPDQARVLASLPSNAEAARFYSLGLVKLREFDIPAARDLFEQATQADPKFALSYSMLSRADIYLGHDDRAKAEAKRGLDLAGKLSRVQRMEVEASYYHALADRGKAAAIYKVLFSLYPDSLDYGLQLAKLQQESYHPDEALETIRQLRDLPSPARDDPGLDLREGGIVLPSDADAADRLFHSAAAKASAQGKKLILAKAEEALCFTNRQHVQTPPECEQAYEMFIGVGNHADAGSCLQLMAEANRQTGHGQQAIPLYEQALRMFQEAGNREMMGVTLNNLSLILQNEGQFGRAEQFYREALQDFQAVNDKANTAAVLGNVADLMVLRGRLGEAANLYRQSWETADASGRARHEWAHTRYGSLLLMKGEVDPARRELEEQVRTVRAYGGDPGQLASSLTALGDVEQAIGNLDGARKDYQEALDTFTKLNAPIAEMQISLAEISLAEGHADGAEALVRAALAEFEKERSAGDEIGGLTSLSRALLAQGKVSDAQDAVAHAFRLADLHDFPAYSLPLQIVQARSKAAAAKPGTTGRNDLAAAENQLRSVIPQSHRLGLYQVECEARLALGELELKRSPAEGRARLSALANEARDRGLQLISGKADDLAAGRKVVEIAAH